MRKNDNRVHDIYFVYGNSWPMIKTIKDIVRWHIAAKAGERR